ncbi:hypothetical protein [Cellulomonas sp. Leaf334]|uniref:hypothetical protein n=1 Tax=Cellulomonas sp. Leaf334 TaxID=1736339 RepID=UPI0006F4EB49|nr:hypothetical protein [Cellulomonas sp. Leaf334]KQR17260.1 hypothetical protein ASF78_08170 [Cellulomonas sp. Leaf334]
MTDRPSMTEANEGGPSLGGSSNARRAWIWWGEAWVLGVVCLLQVGVLWSTGDALLAIIAPALWLMAFVILKCEARLEFRRGWRYGYESATRTFIQVRQGQTPDVTVRAAFRGGDPTPEPWEQHIPPGSAGLVRGDSS